MRTQNVAIALGILITCFSLSVKADDYWGLGIGKASLDILPGFGAQGIEDGVIPKVLFGERDIDSALELEITVGSLDWIAPVVGQHDIYSVSLNGLSFVNLNGPLDLFGKLGLAVMAVAAEMQGTIFHSDVSLNVKYGGGIFYGPTEDFSMRLEYEVLAGANDGVRTGDLAWTGLWFMFRF